MLSPRLRVSKGLCEAEILARLSGLMDDGIEHPQRSPAMRLRYFVLPFAASLVASIQLSAQVVSGRVLDAGTGEGVPQAEVKAVSAEGRELGRARTAADGAFDLRLRMAGTVRLQAQRTRYRATTTGELAVGVRETVGVEVRLSASAVGWKRSRSSAARRRSPRSTTTTTRSAA